jgi:hypothetical protein
MELERLKSFYRQSKGVQAICDHLAAEEKNQTETQLKRVLWQLEEDGSDFRRSEIIEAFRALEEAGCGRYVEGRRGWPSRFVWAVPSLHLAAAAKGQRGLQRDEDSEEDSSVEDDEELIEHCFVLRPGLVVALELPSDLSRSEADRLAAFVQALPFDEDTDS